MTFLDHIGLSGEFIPCDNNLPYINRNFQIIDSILQMSAVSFVEGVPVSPQEGEVYIIENPYYSYGTADSVIGIYNGISWIFVNPKPGFKSWVVSESAFYWFDGQNWIEEIVTDGDVKGPSSSLKNSIARFDGETGKFITDSGITIDDDNIMSGAAAIYSEAIIANYIYTDILGGTNGLIVEDPAKEIALDSMFNTISSPIVEIDSIKIADEINKSYIFLVENKSGAQTLIKNNPSIVTGTGKDFQFKDQTSILVIYSAETDTFNIVSGGGGSGGGVLTVDDKTAREAIPADDRYDGLMVHQLDNRTMWQLQGGILNGDWVLLDLGIVLNTAQVFSANGEITLKSVMTQRVLISGTDHYTATLPTPTIEGQRVWVCGQSDEHPITLNGIDFTDGKNRWFQNVGGTWIMEE